MSNQETSTLQAAVDKVSGAAQSIYGSITGSTADQVSIRVGPIRYIPYTDNLQAQGDRKQDKAAAENDLSHAGASVGGYSVSASGVAKNDEDRSDGRWNQPIGAAKETVGGLVGAEGLRQEGIQQNQDGKAQEAKGQLTDLGKGVGDRISGAVGGAVAGLTGDREEQARRQAQHDEGKTRQRGVEAELEQQAPKEQ